MTGVSVRTTRITAIAAVFLAVMMIGVPTSLLGSGKLGAVGQAAALDDDRKFVVGVIDMTISTLNPNKYTMSAEGMAIFPCYSTLIQYDENDEIIGDLAYRWSSSPDLLTWNFKLVPNAYFCDPADPTALDHQVTAADIIWTFMALQADDGSRLHTYWPDVIESMWSDGPYDVSLKLSQPFVAAMDSFLGCPIYPQYYWEGENFLTFKNSPPIGSGPFYYATDGLPTEGLVELKKNPIWYATENMGMDMRVDTWMLKRESDENTAWLELQAHDIDVMLAVPPNIYKNTLPSELNIIGFDQNAGFVYEFNLNQMTDELRAELGGAFMGGSNNQLLLDETVKKAISYCVDQETFINEVWGGYGSAEATTLVPPANPAHYVYPDSDPFDPAAARQMLIDAGWAYTDTNVPIEDAPLYKAPLCKVGGTDPLSFRFYTLNTAQSWIVGEQLIDSWCELAGIELLEDELSVTDMNSAWYSANYDMWLWDWIFTVKSEAASGVLVVLTTGAIGTDSDVYWSNATYDDLYLQALRTMDFNERKIITDEMQSMAYEMRGCQSVAYRNELYGVNTELWTNFGDWNTNYWLLPDVWPTWLSLRMYPVDNNAPDMYSYGGPTTADVGVEATGFYANAGDDWLADDQLLYRWFWGDGEKTDWSSSGSATHTYDEDGNYTIYVAVKENAIANGFSDYFMTNQKMHCVVSDMSNDAPVVNSVTFLPADPDTGTDVVFTCDATDAESDELFYTWDFGDDHSLQGESTITHQYTDAGFYECTVSVTDNHFGAGARPASGWSGLISVGPNDPPHLTVNDFGSVNVKQKATYDVVASDDNVRDTLQFTWVWGDGTISVTALPEADHTYAYKGTYTITVYCDDLTGLEGHNVSDTGTIYVVNSKNAAPVITEYTATPTDAYTGEEVTFRAVASDADGDGLTFTFTFDTGVTSVQSFGPTAENLPVECVVYHEYSSIGSPTTYVTVSDGSVADVSDLVVVTVEANSEPAFVTPPEDVYLSTGETGTFVVEAIDLDGDEMTCTWEWGDGTTDDTLVDSGGIATADHVYAAGDYTYWVRINDGIHDDVSAAAHAYVNTIPVLEPIADVNIDAGDEWTYVADASDADADDVLNYTWDFGDATDPAYGQTATHTYAAIGSYELNLTVTDGFVLATHTLYSTATVTASDPMVNDPPTVTPLEDVYATIDEVVTFSVEASDPDGDPLTITWDFGDSTGLFVGQSVDHTYMAVGDYTFTVWVDDGAINVSDDATAFVSADEVPTADAGGDRTINEDTLTMFDGTWSSDDIGVVSYEWTIVELSETATGSTPTFEFADPGVYTVTLVVTDTIGQTSAPDTITVTVLDITDPTAVADADVTTVDMGGSVTFDGSSSSDNVDVVSWTWSFFDGAVLVTETTETFSHTFDLAGSYPVELEVADAAGNLGTDTITITVTDTEDPVADAGVDQSVYEGDTVTFNGTASDDNVDVVNWTWSFVYDSASELVYGETAEFVFGIADTYTVTLTVRDAEGYTATDTMTVTVLPDAAPVAVAAIDSPVTVGDTVTFDGTGSSDDNDIVSWIWTFDDNGVSIERSGETQTYVFDTAGIYEITLTVTDSADQTDVATVSVTVEAATVTDEAPVAVAVIDSPATVGDTVTFDGTGSSDDNEIVNWTWSFDDNGVAKELWGETATYVFETVGTYEVTLTVTDDADQTDVATVSVTVEAAPALSDPPVANAGTDQPVSIGAEVEFSGALSSDDVGVVNYTWTFTYNGSVVKLYGVSPSFTFHAAATYTVTLTVTDADGQEDTDTVTVTVNPADTTDDKTFIESYGLPIALLAIIVVAALAFMLMKRKKGGKSTTNTGLDGTTMEEPQEPSQ